MGTVLSPWLMIFTAVHVVLLLLLVAMEIPLSSLGFVIIIQSVVASLNMEHRMMLIAHVWWMSNEKYNN